MHWCPFCHQPCYCDYDDTDYGDPPEDCIHECDEDEEENEELEND